jgi:hypothetical protein
MRLIFISALMLSTGCGGSQRVVPVRNVERAVTVWGDEDTLERQQICLEYASPAEELDSRKVGLTVPIGDQPVNLSYESSQSLAQLYSVSEIMQFGHASLYRLCEAAGNGMIDPKQYGTLFRSTIDQVNDLIALQFRAQQLAKINHQLQVRQAIDELDGRMCRLRAKDGATAQQLYDERAQRRATLVQEFDSLQGTKSDIVAPKLTPPLKPVRRQDLYDKLAKGLAGEEKETGCRELFEFRTDCETAVDKDESALINQYCVAPTPPADPKAAVDKKEKNQ